MNINSILSEDSSTNQCSLSGRASSILTGKLELGRTVEGGEVSLRLDKTNRHGLITGATGTGKTTTLQNLAQQFSDNGVPVFAADIKGDLSGIAAAGETHGKAAARNQSLDAEYNPQSCPVAFWDLFGKHGAPIRTSVQKIGPLMMAAMLRLNETQAGSLNICFRKAEDDLDFLLTLDDLRWTLNEMLEDRETVCKKYGNITASSISAIQRSILSLESQGGEHLFGEPPFDILDLMRVENGNGVVNLLHADQLVDSPKLYSMFLLQLLHSLFEVLPEAGDSDKPKLVFFFDEAHLLFRDAPKPLLEMIERLVRLVRSKGVGVYFVTQSPKDIPDVVLGQLGNRIQHALRAYTPSDRRLIKASADAFRPNPDLDIKAEITELGTGVALVSFLDDEGIPAITEKVKIYAPNSQFGPISEIERSAIRSSCSMNKKYSRAFEPLQQAEEFKVRMYQERGLPIVSSSQSSNYKEGDFHKFVPSFETGPEEPKTKPSLFKRIIPVLFWSAFTFGCASAAGWD